MADFRRIGACACSSIDGDAIVQSVAGYIKRLPAQAQRPLLSRRTWQITAAYIASGGVATHGDARGIDAVGVGMGDQPPGRVDSVVCRPCGSGFRRHPVVDRGRHRAHRRGQPDAQRVVVDEIPLRPAASVDEHDQGSRS